MAKKQGDNTFEDTLEARLRWALESTISHYLGRPDRNAIEDWAATTAMEMGGERSLWQRMTPGDPTQARESPGEGSKNGKVTLTPTRQ